MTIAVRTNVRTAYKAINNMNDAFGVAFRGGMVLGFVLVGLALLVLQVLIMIYKKTMLGSELGTLSREE